MWACDIMGKIASPDLTDKQLRFCQEYLVDLNATQAAIRAEYSAKTANEQGARLLANASVQCQIHKLMDQRSKKTAISAEYVLNGTRAVADASTTSDRDRLKALELLGKHLAMFVHRHDDRGTGVPISSEISAMSSMQLDEFLISYAKALPVS